MDRFGHEIVFAAHAPCHSGLIALGSKCELRNVSRCEMSEELEIDPDQIVRTALTDSHAPFSYLFVTIPGVDSASSGRSSLICLLHRRIQFSPWVPCFPITEIIDLRKDRRSRRAHLSCPRDTKLRTSASHDAGKHDDNNRDHHENFSQHKTPSRRRASQHLDECCKLSVLVDCP